MESSGFVGAIPVARCADGHHIQFALEHDLVGFVDFTDDAEFNRSDVITVAVEFTVVAPPIFYARHGDILVATEVLGANFIGARRRLEFLRVGSYIIWPKIFVKLSGRGW